MINNQKEQIEIVERLNLAIKFTKTHEANARSSKTKREVQCNKTLFPAALKQIGPNDHFAGTIRYPYAGFATHSVQLRTFVLGYYFARDRMAEDLKKLETPLDPETLQNIEYMRSYWEKNETREIIEEIYTESGRKKLSYDYFEESAPIYGLVRISGEMIDFHKLVSLGVPGLRKEIETRKIAALKQNEPTEFLDGLEATLDLFCATMLHYKNQAIELKKNGYSNPNLDKIANTLDHLAVKAPATLHQAIQLAWLYALLSNEINYGRMDSYLSKFYAEDLKTGRITEEEAIALMQNCYELMMDFGQIQNHRIVLGGKDRSNIQESDAFALICLKAFERHSNLLPVISLRTYKGMNDNLLSEAYRLIGKGLVSPFIYNDDVNVPGAMQAYDVDEASGSRYVQFGCGEYVLDGISIGSPNGMLNLVKVLNLCITGGIDDLSGKPYDQKRKSLSDYTSYKEFYNDYIEALHGYLNRVADFENITYVAANKDHDSLFLSLAYNDCIERNRSLLDGGVRIRGAAVEVFGLVNAADSLYVIEELVFNKKSLSAETVEKMILANFSGFEEERKEVRAVSKFGNNISEIDNKVKELARQIGINAKKVAKPNGLDSFLPVYVNSENHVTLGAQTGASCDGRLSRAPMSNGNAPTEGNDTEGLTSLLSSLSKVEPSYNAGCSQQLRISRKMFEENLPAMKAYISTFFNLGGTQLMITCTSREELLEAIKNPEKYKNLMVRIGGWNARFVALSKNLQNEILSRTSY
ncbi:MAG: hypothetical protein JNL74_22445 [Fibrobacteres bacterium]|nr:hypothetical protein [Fibrobacterota bacterium]